MLKSKNSFHPKVSIIIPVYNGSNYLREAIDSALCQTYENIEVIVVNDGSNDGGKTDKICRSYGNQIRYFKKDNGGVATALNKGIEEMTGEYFSWLSHDDVYYPNKIEEQVKFLNTLKDKNTIIYSDVDYIDENSKLTSSTNHSESYPITKLDSGVFSVLKGLTNGCSMLIPRNCFKKVGLFNESLKTTNDYEMWFRIFRNCKKKFLPKAFIKYRLHDKQGTRVEPKYIEESNDLWCMMISSLSKKEILEIADSLFDFYYDMWKQMEISEYNKAALLAKKFSEEEYNSREPKVSIIMPCYNSERYIQEAINSILQQSYANFELLIINDSSMDKTEQIAKENAENDYRISVLRNKYRKGISGAMNTGISVARGEYITRMDSDDISERERIKIQVEFLDENKLYGLCSTNMSSFGESSREKLFEKRKEPLEWLFLWENPVGNASVMYRASIIKDNQIRFGAYELAEDYDFLTKIIPHTRIFFLDSVLYRYRIHNESIFQKKSGIAISNSIKISESLAKKIYGLDVPPFHKYLTVFYNLSNDGNGLNVHKRQLRLWIKNLLDISRKRWGWSDKEYGNARRDGIRRIEEYIAKGKEEEVMVENSFVMKLIIKAIRFPRLVKNQGLKTTVKNILLKLKKN